MFSAAARNALLRWAGNLTTGPPHGYRSCGGTRGGPRRNAGRRLALPRRDRALPPCHHAGLVLPGGPIRPTLCRNFTDQCCLLTSRSLLAPRCPSAAGRSSNSSARGGAHPPSTSLFVGTADDAVFTPRRLRIAATCWSMSAFFCARPTRAASSSSLSMRGVRGIAGDYIKAAHQARGSLRCHRNAPGAHHVHGDILEPPCSIVMLSPSCSC